MEENNVPEGGYRIEMDMEYFINPDMTMEADFNVPDIRITRATPTPVEGTIERPMTIGEQREGDRSAPVDLTTSTEDAYGSSATPPLHSPVARKSPRETHVPKGESAPRNDHIFAPAVTATAGPTIHGLAAVPGDVFSPYPPLQQWRGGGYYAPRVPVSAAPPPFPLFVDEYPSPSPSAQFNTTAQRATILPPAPQGANTTVAQGIEAALAAERADHHVTTSAPAPPSAFAGSRYLESFLVVEDHYEATRARGIVSPRQLQTDLTGLTAIEGIRDYLAGQRTMYRDRLVRTTDAYTGTRRSYAQARRARRSVRALSLPVAQREWREVHVSEAEQQIQDGVRWQQERRLGGQYPTLMPVEEDEGEDTEEE